MAFDAQQAGLGGLAVLVSKVVELLRTDGSEDGQVAQAVKAIEDGLRNVFNPLVDAAQLSYNTALLLSFK
jgi:hypothetical protein